MFVECHGSVPALRHYAPRYRISLKRPSVDVAKASGHAHVMDDTGCLPPLALVVAAALCAIFLVLL